MIVCFDRTLHEKVQTQVIRNKYYVTVRETLFADDQPVLSPMINDEVVLCVQTKTPKLAGDQWSRQFCGLYNQELLT